MKSGTLSALWARRANFAALSAWLITLTAMAVSALLFFRQDFDGFYAAARVLLAHGDPYDYRQTAAMMQAITGYACCNPFYYPPWFALAMAPFGLLPHQAARTMWMSCNVILWIGGLLALSAAMGWPARPGPDQPPREWGWRWGGRWLLYLMATYLFAWMTLRYEQTGIAMFALLTFALWMIRLRRFGLSGILLALMLTKPTVSVVIVGALLLWFARNRRWQAVGAFWATLALLLAISAPFLFSWLRHISNPQYRLGLRYFYDASGVVWGTRINTTLLDWLAAVRVPAPLSAWIYFASAALGLSAAVLFAWRASSAVTVAAVAAVVGFWLASYALQYDFTPLTVSLFFVLRELGRRPRRVRLIGLGMLAGLLSLPVWERAISDGFWLVIGLTSLLGLLALSRPRAISFPSP